MNYEESFEPALLGSKEKVSLEKNLFFYDFIDILNAKDLDNHTIIFY